MGDVKPGTTEIKTTEEIMSAGDGVVFRGAPNQGAINGPAHSPQLPAALEQGGA